MFTWPRIRGFFPSSILGATRYIQPAMGNSSNTYKFCFGLGTSAEGQDPYGRPPPARRNRFDWKLDQLNKLGLRREMFP